MAFLFRTHLRLACTSIKENRTRSFLTCLGIAIGIASIILILSLTGSISNLISEEVSDESPLQSSPYEKFLLDARDMLYFFL